MGDQPRLSSHSHAEDERNASIVVGLRTLMPGDEPGPKDAGGGAPGLRIVPLREAAVSVMDSGFMLGDGLWEGIRLHRGVLVKGRKHLRRLYEGCLALDMRMDVCIDELEAWVYRVIDANEGMRDGVHIRLMVTRGLKPTPFQSPYITVGNPTVAIIPEYKTASPALRERGLRLFTAHVRRCAPDTQDPMLNTHSKHNCIQGCIQAHHAGADEALMLDPSGFVATCNSTNFFIVRDGEVLAPSSKYQLHGITRQAILDLCAANGIPARETDFTLADAYSAREAFVTGTFAGVIPVRTIDGRAVGDPSTRFGAGGAGGEVALPGPVTARLMELYIASVEEETAGGRPCAQ